MTFKVIRGQGQGHVNDSKMTIFEIYLLRHFSTNQKISNGFSYWTKISKISQAGFFNFLLLIESRDFKVCQKNRLRPILMKLGMMSEIDETFMTIWLSRSSEVRFKVRRWPQSPVGTIFSLLCLLCCAFSALMLLVWHQESSLLKTEWWGVGVVNWGEVQICIWLSWYHYHSLSLGSVKSRLVLVVAHPGNPGQSPEGHKMDVCVRACIHAYFVL